MLIIRRRPGESILIGDEIEVQVTEIGPNRVKLCITAPREVPVLRKEVKLTREENLAAADAVERLAEVAKKFSNFSQGPEGSSDMGFRADTSGIRKKGEPGTGKTPGSTAHRM